MKRFLPLLLCSATALLSPQAARAITASGVITNAETWSGTITLTGDVTIQETGSVTVQAGTVIKARAGADDRSGGTDPVRIELIVNGGRLLVNGTTNSPVVFTSARTTPAAGDWYGLRVLYGTVTLKNVRAEFGRYGLHLAGGGDSYLWQNCTFSGNSEHGLWVDGVGACEFTNLQCLGNGENGVHSTRSGLNVTINGGVLRGNGSSGISVSPGQATLTNVEASTNAVWGMHCGVLRATRCVVRGNGSGGVQTGDLTLTDSTVNDNGSTGVTTLGDALVTGSQVLRNQGTGVLGTAPCCSARVLRVENCTVNNNTGRGVSAEAYTSNLRVTGSVVRFNGTMGVHASGSLTLAGSTVSNNGGEGVYADVADVSESTVANNRAGLNVRRLSLKNGTIQANAGVGVLVRNSGSETALFNAGFTGNVVKGNGVGVEFRWNNNTGRAELTGNDLFGNTGVDLRNSGTAAILANDNYWGAPTTAELQAGVINPPRVEASLAHGSGGQVLIQRFSSGSVLDPASVKLAFTRPAYAGASRTVSGTIATAQSWTGTVFVSGDTRIAEGGTVTLQAGTRVVIEALRDEQIGGLDTSRVEFSVEGGTLIANGTAASPVVFTSARTTPAAGDWHGLRVLYGAVTFRNARAEFGRHGLFLAVGGDQVWESCTFSGNSEHGLWLDGVGAYEFTNLHCLGNGGSGVHSTRSGFNVTINGGVLRGNGNSGISVSAGQATLTNVEASTNAAWGIHGGVLRAARCVVRGNGSGGVQTGDLTLTDSTVNDNGSTGVTTLGDALVTGSQVLRNQGTGVLGTAGCCSARVLRVENCTVNNNTGRGVSAESYTSDLRVTGSVVRFNGTMGVHASGSLTLAGSTVSNNGGEGVYADVADVSESTVANNRAGLNVGRLSLKNGTIQANAGVGVLVRNSGNATALFNAGFTGNVVTGNGVGVELQWNNNTGRAELTGNDLFGNTGVDLRNSGTAAILANDNYWGAPTTAELQAGTANLTRVYDRQDNSAVGAVSIERYARTALTAPPTVTTQPQSLAVTAGASATFTVAATGKEPLSYRWQKAGTDLADGGRISGAATNRLVLSGAVAGDAGSYVAVVRNAYGQVLSDAATLTVNAAGPLYHTADYRDPRWKIDGVEANSVLALWRAGAYHREAAGIAGFAPGTGDTNGPRHAADFRTPYWKIDATEVNRVLSYWRATAYHADATAPEGFAPGSAGSRPGLQAQPPAPVIDHATGAYTAGGVLLVTNRVTFTGKMLSLGCQPELPSGWTLVGVTGDGSPEAADGEIIFLSSTLPSPLNFTYSVQVAAGAAGILSLRTRFEHQLEGTVRPTQAYAAPSPLTLAPLSGGGPGDGMGITQTTAPHYTGAATLLVTNRITYAGKLLSLGCQPQLPAGWSLGTVTGDGGPEASDGEIIFLSSTLPSPLTFTYAVIVPAGATGRQELRNRFEYQLEGAVVPTVALATPNPLVLDSFTGNPPPVVALTQPAPGAAFTAPASITLEASATDGDGIAKVEFFEGANKLGEALAAPYRVMWNNAGAGTYTLSARATDTRGASTMSAPVTVTVVAAGGRVVRVVPASATRGATVTVAVEFVAQGNENTLGFSLAFTPALLGYQGWANGSGLPVTTQVLVNTNQAAAGRLGLLLALPIGQSLAAGTQALVQVTFVTASGLDGSTNTTVEFGDVPVIREITSSDVDILPASYLAGNVEITVGVEGDVSPRPRGDLRVSAADWTLIGRFVAGMSTVTNTSEFVRADIAPRATRGDGRLTPADWAQAGRYAAGLDALQTAGGPSSAGSVAARHNTRTLATVVDRRLRIGETGGVAGQEVTVPLELAAVGSENTVGLSVRFDVSQLTYLRAIPTPEWPPGGQLVVNTNEAAGGRLGLLLALPAGQAFTAGTHPLIQLIWRTAAGATGTLVLAAGDQPVAREIVSTEADVLPAEFLDGRIVLTSVAAPTVLPGSSRYEGGRFTFQFTGQAGTPYTVETSTDLEAWSEAGTVIGSTGAATFTDVPRRDTRRFYRLRAN